MENRLKSHISKILQSTFNSCRPKTNSDVSEHRKTHKERRLIDLFSPKPQPLPISSSFICKPKPHLSGTPHFPANRIDEAISKKERKKKLDCRRRRRRNNATTFSSSITTDNYYYNWWSSEDTNTQSDTLFSRRSVSSDSSSVLKSRVKGNNGGGDVDGFALVAKDSSDPYEDFRVSMVDMIVEKEIFGVEELENMVECYLSLNSAEHHKVIVEVFAEIWETLLLTTTN